MLFVSGWTINIGTPYSKIKSNANNLHKTLFNKKIFDSDDISTSYSLIKTSYFNKETKIFTKKNSSKTNTNNSPSLGVIIPTAILAGLGFGIGFIIGSIMGFSYFKTRIINVEPFLNFEKDGDSFLDFQDIQINSDKLDLDNHFKINHVSNNYESIHNSKILLNNERMGKIKTLIKRRNEQTQIKTLNETPTFQIQYGVNRGIFEMQRTKERRFYCNSEGISLNKIYFFSREISYGKLDFYRFLVVTRDINYSDCFYSTTGYGTYVIKNKKYKIIFATLFHGALIGVFGATVMGSITYGVAEKIN